MANISTNIVSAPSYIPLILRHHSENTLFRQRYCVICLLYSFPFLYSCFSLWTWVWIFSIALPSDFTNLSSSVSYLLLSPSIESLISLLYILLWNYDFHLTFFLTSLLEYNCFKMLCYFLLYNEVNQLYVYIYPHIPSLLHFPPTLHIPPF